VGLHDAVDAVFRLQRDLADVRGVELVTAADLPDVRVPAALAEVCLFNLVSNGIKYSDPEKARRFVEVGGRLVKADEGAGEDLVLEVRDNGIGIPDGFRDQLFEQFTRQAQGPSEIEGTGLGLSIVRETAEAIGARAWVEFPPEGGGTSFLLAFPMETRIRE
jgi:signal transduction histidine kinase